MSREDDHTRAPAQAGLTPTIDSAKPKFAFTLWHWTVWTTGQVAIGIRTAREIGDLLEEAKRALVQLNVIDPEADYRIARYSRRVPPSHEPLTMIVEVDPDYMIAPRLEDNHPSDPRQRTETESEKS